jgi:hypothetical protein
MLNQFIKYIKIQKTLLLKNKLINFKALIPGHD